MIDKDKDKELKLKGSRNEVPGEVADLGTSAETYCSTSKRWKVLSILFFTVAIGLSLLVFDTSRKLKSTKRSLSYVENKLFDANEAFLKIERALGLKQSLNSELSTRVNQMRNELESALDSIAQYETALGVSQANGRDLSNQVDRLVQNLEYYRESFEDAQDSASSWRSEAERLVGELDDCITIANDRLRKMNSAIDTANSGSIWLTDIPSAGFNFYSTDPYESLRRKYNDLVDRFNAAVNRANDLGDLLARSLRELE